MRLKKKYSIVYCGSWGQGAAGLRTLLKCKSVKIIKVYTKYDYHRNDYYLNLTASLAKKNKIPTENSDICYLTKKRFEKNVIDLPAFDFLVSCCFDRIFTKKILSLPKIMPINVHPSLLPKYRGVKPIENAIINNERKIGITLHELSDTIDEGNIIMQKKIDLKDDYTYTHVYDLVNKKVENMLSLFFKNPKIFIRNKTKQDKTKISNAPRLNFKFRKNATLKEIREKYYNEKNLL